MERSFPQFRHLPAELRCKIWRMAIPRRIIPARLKLDLDAWNAATETDWMQVHYRVVPDGRRSSVTPITMVNHEARHEMIQNDKPLRIGREAMERSLGTQQVDDTCLDTLCDSSRILWFNPECDVLEWMEPQRWSTGSQEQPCPLFLAACLSVRYVEFKLDISMCKQLEILAFAVLDQGQPLETLTIIIKKGAARYRLTRRPSISKALLGDTSKDMALIMAHSPACFFPWYGTTNLWEDLIQDPYPKANQMLASVLPLKKRPLVSSMRLDTRFAIYEIFDPGELEAEEYVKRRWDLLYYTKSFDAGFIDPPHEEDGFLYTLQSDILKWVTGLKRTLGLASAKILPIHGFCSPDYGLPAYGES